METMELHRGRLIDHIQLVVKDLEASRRFYAAVFQVLGIPIAGSGEDHFWADELFISTASSEAALGHLTGRHHLAFQAKDKAMVEAFHQAALAAGIGSTVFAAVRDASGSYDPALYLAAVLMAGGGCALLALGRYPDWTGKNPAPSGPSSPTP